MQKAKKMSKQTLVIAVLAVLLVLSLALSVTGAWFTDKASDTSEVAINFATVDVTNVANEGTVKRNDTASTPSTLLLPGDIITLGGTVTNGASTVNTYVAVIISDIVVTGYTGELDAQGKPTGDAKVLTAAIAEYLDTTGVSVTGAGDVVATVAAGDPAKKIDGANVYLMEAGDEVDSFTYGATITLKTTLGNSIVDLGENEDDDSDNVTYYLNSAAAPASLGSNEFVIKSVTISATVEVVAIQQPNLTDATAAAAALREIY